MQMPHFSTFLSSWFIFSISSDNLAFFSVSSFVSSEIFCFSCSLSTTRFCRSWLMTKRKQREGEGKKRGKKSDKTLSFTWKAKDYDVWQQRSMPSCSFEYLKWRSLFCTTAGSAFLYYWWNFSMYKTEVVLVYSHVILTELTLAFEDVIFQGEELHSFILFSLQSILLFFHHLYSV